MIDGVTVAERVSFARFFDKDCLYSSYAIGNNPLSPDAMHPMHITMTTKFNVNMSSLIFYYEPNVEWIVQEVIPQYTCYLSISVIVIIIYIFRTVWIWTVMVPNIL